MSSHLSRIVLFRRAGRRATLTSAVAALVFLISSAVYASDAMSLKHGSPRALIYGESDPLPTLVCFEFLGSDEMRTAVLLTRVAYTLDAKTNEVVKSIIETERYNGGVCLRTPRKLLRIEIFGTALETSTTIRAGRSRCALLPVSAKTCAIASGSARQRLPVGDADASEQ